MENASKALIIAGAILLSVLIISLGIMVYNNAKNTVGSANLSQHEISTFNSQWEAYRGSTQTASQVMTMAQAVIASNAAEDKNGSKRFITFATTDQSATNLTASATKPNITLPTIDNSKTYKITLGYSSNGLVCVIGYTANN